MKPTLLRPAVFLDKDGTLLDDVPYNVDPLEMRLAPGAVNALALFARMDVPVVVISNQSGVALGKFDEAALVDVERTLHELAARAGARLAGVYFCPHHPQGTVAKYRKICECRKPAPGMIERAARDLGLDLARSWFVGDILDDVEAGHRAGCRAVLIDNGNETLWQRGPLREPDAIAKDMHEAARVIEAAWHGELAA
ncbi:MULTISPECIES: HAD-IIIA family hydrolase [unclassified Caballeronia]|uniref:D-glycero-alpha-D-manno-heptose-1,7-bisphosphate 7-phosphatase n=1 Tax=unclassified Caballeronia TaxID=2646786 RepID=UPI002867943C|nr:MULTISPECIES: HAD-IIIA family hydrolase [unclassified Caballeronia]MDR5775903.1 HAD-IIIA family hydrolase [Caballeronia sp. LZ002]MDR5851342.1 HAD-IIIA family hydrolase [Caballeronia sp. LZ003]